MLISSLVAFMAVVQSTADLPGPLEAGWEGEKVCVLLEENETMRALRCSFAPGTGHERHYHPPHFGYVLSGGPMQMTDEKGTRRVDTTTGTSWWSEGIGWHQVLNVGDETTIYLIIEPKAALTHAEH